MADEKSPVNVDISAGAKLNIDVKTEIPKESSGRFLDALTDAIRPFTEARGLRADQIRLQREEVLLEITKRAKKRLYLEGIEVKPIPNRTLIPLLEKASLADKDNEALIEAWSNLLAASSKGGCANNAIYSDILSKLDPIHLKYLNFLFTSKNSFPHNDVALQYNIQEILNQFSKWYENNKIQSIDVEGMSDDEWEKEAEKILDHFNVPGMKTLSGAVRYREIGSNIDLHEFPEAVIYALDSFLLTETLYAAPPTWVGPSRTAWLQVNKITYLGYDFYNVCNGLRG